MTYKANEPRRHKIPRARHRVTNWPEYDGALQRRGSLTVWVTPEALVAWHPPGTGQRGRSPQYADLAIETGHLLRLAFGRPWRQTEGLLRSLAAPLGLGIGVPDHRGRGHIRRKTWVNAGVSGPVGLLPSRRTLLRVGLPMGTEGVVGTAAGAAFAGRDRLGRGAEAAARPRSGRRRP